MANPITQTDGGFSIAPLYDTVGGNSGGPNAEIEADRILLTHELGHTLFSERYALRFRNIVSAATAASTAFNTVLQGLPRSPWRLMGLGVFTVDAGAVANDFTRVTVNARDPDQDLEIPIWAWAGGTISNIFITNGAGVVTAGLFLPTAVQMAALSENIRILGTRNGGAASSISELALRGDTAAFGAGTRTVTARVLIGLPTASPGQTESTGLPVPSW